MFRNLLETLWEWIKPLFHALGIFFALGAFMFYVRKTPTDFEGILTFVIPVAYIALRWYWLIDEARQPARDAQKAAQKRQYWRTCFDNSKECQQYLALIRRLQPSSIYLTHTQPPSEKYAPRPVNRLYPEATPSIPAFSPRIQMKDSKGNVIFSQAWPALGISDKESMDYFYDWLSYHLPANLSYNRRDNVYSYASLSSNPTRFTMKETMDGQYTIYDSRLDDDDPPDIHYGYVLYKKKTQ